MCATFDLFCQNFQKVAQEVFKRGDFFWGVGPCFYLTPYKSMHFLIIYNIRQFDD